MSSLINLAALSAIIGRFDIYGIRPADRSVMNMFLRPGDHDWNGPNPVDGSLNMGPWAGIAAVSATEGRFDIFGIRGDGGVMNMFLRPGDHDWNGPNPVDGSLNMGPWASIAAVSATEGRFDIFGIRGDGGVMNMFLRPGDHDWNGPNPVDGSLNMGPWAPLQNQNQNPGRVLPSSWWVVASYMQGSVYMYSAVNSVSPPANEVAGPFDEYFDAEDWISENPINPPEPPAPSNGD